MTPPPPEPQAGEPDPPRDDFAPPDEPCECYCLHCNRVFMSDRIWFQKVINSRDAFDGLWMCPTPNCDGTGFSFDIFPTDPSHPVNQGWHDDDDDDDDEADPADGSQGADTSAEWDPEEPRYAELDEEYGEEGDADDIEGEEWKHGLQPGERPPDPPWIADARREWEAEQKKFDEPDTRPREIDWADREPPSSGTSGSSFTPDDIPF